jgi:hypothetical protein
MKSIISLKSYYDVQKLRMKSVLRFLGRFLLSIYCMFCLLLLSWNLPIDATVVLLNDCIPNETLFTPISVNYFILSIYVGFTSIVTSVCSSKGNISMIYRIC